MDLSKKKEAFIDKFKFLSEDFKIIPIENAFGLTIQKDFKENDTVSAITIYISNEQLTNSNSKKLLNLSAIYGKPTTEGITIRNSPKINEPIDFIELQSDRFIYDIISSKIFNKKREVTGAELFWYFYKQHIKPTKFFNGFWIRLKLFTWKIILFNFFRGIYNFSYFILYLISGDKYSFSPIFREEKLNGRIISSSFEDLIDRAPLVKELDEKSEKVEFFGHKIDYWKIVSYATINLLLYSYFFYINYRPQFLVKIFNNSFLTLLYVVVSLCILQIIIPKTLKKLIRITSTIAFFVRYEKSIKI